jgi:outer membrane protein
VKCFKRLTVNIIVTLFAAGCFFSGHTAEAIEPAIVVLDMQKAIADSAIGQKAKKEMEKKVEELQAKFKKDEDELLALQEEIEKKSSVWSEEKKQDKAIEFQKKRRDLRLKQDDANLELKKMQEQQLGPILKDMEQIVEKVAKEKGYKIILPKAAIVYNDESIEITSEVTKALNETAK